MGPPFQGLQQPDDPAIVPDAPASVSASRSNGDIAVSWSASVGTTGYDVQYSTDNETSWTRAATNQSGTSYTLGNADSANAYVFGVRALNADGESGWTKSASVGPPAAETQAPGDVSSVSVVHNGSSLSVSWSAAERAASYHVTYSSDGGQSWSLAALAHQGTSLTIDNADSGATYIVGVRAGNDAGYGGWTDSPPASASAPDAVGSVSVVHNGGSLSVSWSAAERAASYHVTYSYDGGQSWHLAALAHEGTSLTIDNADAGKTYVVGVRAGNAYGFSGWTDSAPAGPP